jgi:DNA end-binding protein Ku
MPRPILSVTLAFGLVNIPVRLYTAAASKRVRFHWLDARTGQRVRQQFVSPGSAEEDDDAEVRAAQARTPVTVQPDTAPARDSAMAASEVFSRDELHKGYEVAPQQYVSLTAQELKALEAEANDSAAIQEFVPLSAIPPAFMDKAYYLGPEKGMEKVYRLLARAMERQGYGAIAKVIMRGKEKVVLVRPLGDDRLLMEVLYYADEVRDVNEIPLPEVSISEAELRLAEQVLRSMAADRWEPGQYRDTFRERVLALIEQKRQGWTVHRPIDRRKPERIIDLMDALKRSLKQPRSTDNTASPAVGSQRKRRAG